jgi:hypothetical protein
MPTHWAADESSGGFDRTAHYYRRRSSTSGGTRFLRVADTIGATVRWPTVLEGEGDRPRVIGHDVDPGLRLARPPEIVAWGRIEGIPWQIQAFITSPGPGGKWWEHGPVGPVLEFALGKEGQFGGGEASTYLNDGTHLTASIDFFGSHPDIVAWLGVVSDDVARLEVRLDDGDVRTIELHPGPPDFRRLFWFFPPRAAAGRVLAFSADGRELQREDLVDVDVHPRSNAGTTVNGFAYPVGRPPPGWPDDPTEYRPGEGPRHAEDFHLHEATFPLYVVPPDRWDGYVGLSGSRSSGRELERVGFGYVDEPGTSRRGFEVSNEHPGRRPRLERPLRPEDVGIWWSDPFPSDDTVNFAARFLSREERRELTGDRGSLDTGPVRVAGIVELDVTGQRVEAALREYRALPSLRSIRFDLPGVRLVLHGWEMTFDELERHARTLERLALGTNLFSSMEAAQARTDRRFGELHGHEDR